ncbi:hypothetical protein CRE_17865 [Caenorhabditis remanei]|uniref:Uncharacterized protein n=1 Tax=Caenorhabditis remanei TaxID=31234 RepID=E3MDS7_CAERE|nr:hypothetical protein CRE_17865 [Caenorhabditis remanei]
MGNVTHRDELWNKLSSGEKDLVRELHKKDCKEYYNGPEYGSGSADDKVSYRACCEFLGMCGMSGWTIALIIIIVLLCLAGAAAAFWFFYYKRKMGGRDEKKDIELSESTESEKSSTF